MSCVGTIHYASCIVVLRRTFTWLGYFRWQILRLSGVVDLAGNDFVTFLRGCVCLFLFFQLAVQLVGLGILAVYREFIK